MPRNAVLRILGALWTSSFFPERCPDGRVLVRVIAGGARAPGTLDLSDEELVHGEIAAVQGVSAAPGFARVFRHRRGIPQYTMNHLAHLEVALANLPGLIVTGNAYRGIDVNDCARNAWGTAERACSELAATLGRIGTAAPHRAAVGLGGGVGAWGTPSRPWGGTGAGR